MLKIISIIIYWTVAYICLFYILFPAAALALLFAAAWIKEHSHLGAPLALLTYLAGVAYLVFRHSRRPPPNRPSHPLRITDKPIGALTTPAPRAKPPHPTATPVKRPRYLHYLAPPATPPPPPARPANPAAARPSTAARRPTAN